MKFLSLALALVMVTMPFTASAEKAKTIDELAKMFDSSQCKSCHAEIYAQWEQSHHARPLMGVKGGLMLTPLATKGGSPFSPDDPKKATIKTFPCFKCHLPQATKYAEDSFAVEVAEALIAKDSAKIAKLQITCIVCHNEKAIVHKLTEGFPEKGVIYGSKNVDNHPGGKIKKSVIMKEAPFCGQCHGLGPNFEFDNPIQCANLYGSYEHAYIPAGGTQTCQECHMQKVNGKADHLIAPNFNDDKKTSEQLAKTITLDVQTLGYEWLRKANDYRPLLVVNTKITHTAGHRIPDG